MFFPQTFFFRLLNLAFLFLLVPWCAGAQVPVISGYTPLSGPVGTTVTISGANFNPVAGNNLVYFGAVRAAVTAASNTSLTVIVPTGATQQPLLVRDSVGGLSGTFSRPFGVTFPSTHQLTFGDFDPKKDYQLGSGSGGFPNALAVGDLDGDGRVDILAGNNDPTGQARALYVVRNISMPGRVTLDTSLRIVLPDAGVGAKFSTNDIDGDGKLDLVMLNQIVGPSEGVLVYRNLSSPGNLVFSTTPVLVYNASVMGVYDVDGDGREDLITDSAVNYLCISLNTSVPGAISFAPKVKLFYPNVASASSSLLFYDINNDGKLDLVSANNYQVTPGVLTMRAIIIPNNSTPGNIVFGTLLATNSVPGTAGGNINIADYDSDGKPDISLGSITNGTSTGDRMSIWRNTSTSNTNLSFASAYNITGMGFVMHSASDDFDGDGKPDIALVNSNPNTLFLLRNTATAGTINATSFAPAAVTPSNTLPVNIVSADVDGDGKPDLVTMGSYNILSIYRNHPDPMSAHQPAVACDNDSLKMFLTSSHKGAICRWQLKVAPGNYSTLGNASPYSGAATDTLRIAMPPTALNGAIYRCAVETNGITKFTQDDTIYVRAAPAVPLITRSGSVLSTGLPMNYQFQWYRDSLPVPGAVAASYTASTNGLYTVRVTNTAGCSATSAVVSVGGLMVGQQGFPEIKVYPNPVQGRLAIEAPAETYFLLTDLYGKVVLQGFVTGEINTHFLTDGIYLLRLTDKNGLPAYQEKIVKWTR